MNNEFQLQPLIIRKYFMPAPTEHWGPKREIAAQCAKDLELEEAATELHLLTQKKRSVESLSDQELNMKLARLCGLHVENNPVYGMDGKLHDSWSLGIEGDKETMFPDYCNSLDAAAEFEKTLNTEELQCAYVSELVQIPWHDAWSFTDAAKAVTAPARRRAEAFVKVMEAAKP